MTTRERLSWYLEFPRFDKTHWWRQDEREEIIRRVEGGKVGGRQNLGGEDIDRNLMVMVSKKLVELGLARLERREPEEVERVRRRVVEWKIRHGSKPDGVWQLTNLSGVAPGAPLRWTSGEIAERVQEKVREAVAVCEAFLKRADERNCAASGVLLIGGTSQLPSVKTALEAKFPGLKALPWEQRIAAVAVGAAWKAAGHEAQSLLGEDETEILQQEKQLFKKQRWPPLLVLAGVARKYWARCA